MIKATTSSGSNTSQSNSWSKMNFTATSWKTTRTHCKSPKSSKITIWRHPALTIGVSRSKLNSWNIICYAKIHRESPAYSFLRLLRLKFGSWISNSVSNWRMMMMIWIVYGANKKEELSILTSCMSTRNLLELLKCIQSVRNPMFLGWRTIWSWWSIKTIGMWRTPVMMRCSVGPARAIFQWLDMSKHALQTI